MKKAFWMLFLFFSVHAPLFATPTITQIQRGVAASVDIVAPGVNNSDSSTSITPMMLSTDASQVIAPETPTDISSYFVTSSFQQFQFDDSGFSYKDSLDLQGHDYSGNHGGGGGEARSSISLTLNVSEATPYTLATTVANRFGVAWFTAADSSGHALPSSGMLQPGAYTFSAFDEIFDILSSDRPTLDDGALTMTLRFSAAGTVPEPNAFVLVLIGLGTVVFMRRGLAL